MITYPEHLRGSALPMARGARAIAGDWSVLRVTRQIGFGEPDFERAIERVMTWRMHDDAGVRVRKIKPERGTTGTPSHLQVGDVVELRLGPWFVGVLAPCVVVDVLDESITHAVGGRRTVREVGFAYGTLKGHPERGEEAFVVRLLSDGSVVGSIAAFSQPARWFTQLMPPVSRAVQHEIARRYLTAMLPDAVTSHDLISWYRVSASIRSAAWSTIRSG